MAYIEGKTGKWEYVIGLEVHAQILSQSKLFSASSTQFGAAPNANVSFIDGAMPGMLPVLNEECIRQAVKSSLALNLDINKHSVFDRKNYFYPDLPQGYQISQFYHPIATNGYLALTDNESREKKIRINRLHIEQDAGKSIHDQMKDISLIDLNRSGIGLMEIVSEPDISSPEEAAAYFKKLRGILRFVGSCDGDMEKGSMRADANISIRKPGAPLGTRCEIKNLNSMKNLFKAIVFEAERQVKLLESGDTVRQETRLFDAKTGETRTMRSKEEATDYRYFPDPDLIPIELDDSYIDNIKASMPELPDAKALRYKTDFALSEYDASVLVSDNKITEYFEIAAQYCNNKKLLSNWIIVELFGYLNKASLDLPQSKITPMMIAGIVSLIEAGKISGKIAKTVFEIMCESGKDPQMIVEEEGLIQISDEAAIAKIADEVMTNNADKVIEYTNGKKQLFGFFVGQVIKHSDGKANPAMVNKILKDKL